MAAILIPRRTSIREDRLRGECAAYEEQVEGCSEALRPLVVQSMEAFLDCGRLRNMFGDCRFSH